MCVDDSVFMGGRLVVGLVLLMGFGWGRWGVWVRRVLWEDGLVVVLGCYNERSFLVMGGFVVVVVFVFFCLFLVVVE